MAFAHLHQEIHVDATYGVSVADVSAVEIVRLPAGNVTDAYSTAGSPLQELRLGSLGDVAWVYREDIGLRAFGQCGAAPTCVTASTVTAIVHGSTRPFDTGKGFLGHLDISRNGRFLAIDKQGSDPFDTRSGPVRVIDWSLYATEDLTAGPYSSRARISDDGSLIATGTGSSNGVTGWFEFAMGS